MAKNTKKSTAKSTTKNAGSKKSTKKSAPKKVTAAKGGKSKGGKSGKKKAPPKAGEAAKQLSGEAFRKWNHVAAMQEVWPNAQRGHVINVPSATVEGRTDIAVVLYPSNAESDGSALIIRNRGKYSAQKSAKLAEQFSKLVGMLADPGDDCDAHQSEAGDWLHFIDMVVPPAVQRVLDNQTAAPAKKSKAKAKGKRGKKAA